MPGKAYFKCEYCRPCIPGWAAVKSRGPPTAGMVSGRVLSSRLRSLNENGIHSTRVVVYTIGRCQPTFKSVVKETRHAANQGVLKRARCSIKIDNIPGTKGRTSCSLTQAGDRRYLREAARRKCRKDHRPTDISPVPGFSNQEPLP